MPKPTSEPRNILIIGGGPSGLTALMTFVREYRSNPEKFKYRQVNVDLLYNRESFDRSQTIRVDSETADIIKYLLGPQKFAEYSDSS